MQTTDTALVPMTKKPTTHIICFSGGHSSALVAIEVVRRYGKDNVILLNHDISDRYEAQTIKDFKRAVAAYLGLPVTYANFSGLTANDLPSQFDVCLHVGAFKQPSTGNALCTYYLKTLPFMNYLERNFPLNETGGGPEYVTNEDCIIYYGFDEDEQHRISRRTGILASAGYASEYPLARWPSTLESTEEIGIPRPTTYSVYRHGNCKGCLKAGLQHWYVTYCTEPAIWQEAVDAEEAMRIKKGRVYSILKDQRTTPAKPLLLSSLVTVFDALQAAGVPATEHYPAGKFQSALKQHRLATDAAEAAGLVEVPTALACECFSPND